MRRGKIDGGVVFGLVMFAAVAGLVAYMLFGEILDPKSSRFSPGDQAVVAGVYTMIFPSGDSLAPGTRLTVGRDDGGFDSRDIAVTVDSGEFRDQSGTLTRGRVRPL